MDNRAARWVLPRVQSVACHRRYRAAVRTRHTKGDRSRCATRQQAAGCRYVAPDTAGCLHSLGAWSCAPIRKTVLLGPVHRDQEHRGRLPGLIAASAVGVTLSLKHQIDLVPADHRQHLLHQLFVFVIGTRPKEQLMNQYNPSRCLRPTCRHGIAARRWSRRSRSIAAALAAPQRRALSRMRQRVPTWPQPQRRRDPKAAQRVVQHGVSPIGQNLAGTLCS